MAFATGITMFTGHGQLGNWADPNNWGGTTPDAAAHEIVPVSTTLDGSFTAKTLMLLGTETVTVNGTLNTSSLGICDSFMVCAHAVAMFTPTSVLNTAGGIVVGAGSVGTLIAESGNGHHSTLNTVDGKLGQKADGNGTIRIDGAVWNNAQHLFVGEYGVGDLAVTDGGKVNVGTDFIVGYMAGSTGTVSIASGGQLHVAAFAKIGGSDPGNPGGTGAVTVGAGSLFAVDGALKIASTSSLTLSGGTVTVADATIGLSIWTGAVLSGNGVVTAGTIDDAGTIQAAGGTLVLNGPVTGSGLLQIAANSTAKLTAATIGHIAIAFTGADATLSLAHGVASLATISGFAAGDHIVMAGVDQITWNGSSDVLTLSSAGHVVDTLHVAGAYAGNPFTLTQSAAGAVIGLATQQAMGVHS